MIWPRFLLCFFAIAACSRALAETPTVLPASLPGTWTYFGLGQVKTTKDTATLQEGFAATTELYQDGILTVTARAPEGTAEVQIWGAVRCRDREHRYVFALRGGSDPELFFARYAPDGHTKFLGFAPLDKAPEVGAWQKLRVVSVGNRFQIYLGDEKLPRINVEDPDAFWQKGGVAIGGGWLPAEFSQVEARPLSALESKEFAGMGDQTWQPPDRDKEAERKAQRAAYAPLVVPPVTQVRTDVSLDGQWLFQPAQTLGATEKPAVAADDDRGWHVVKVPSFWGPTVPWLYGEQGFKYLQGISRSKGIADKFLADLTAQADAQTFDWKNTKSGWYRHHFELPPSVVGKHLEVCFDAIAKVSEVWLNGVQIATHKGMFSEVRCDVSALVQAGDNVVAVHIIPPAGEDTLVNADEKEEVAVTVEVTKAMMNSLPHGMYPNATFTAGIWQPVKLEITDPVAVSEVYARPRLDGGDFDITVRNASPDARRVSVETRIVDAADGSVLHRWNRAEATFDTPARGSKTITLAAAGLKPKLWTPAAPNLYRLETTVFVGEARTDERAETFGFRTFTVEGNRLLLNGKPYWLRGGNLAPNTLRPNDGELARAFFRFAKAGNVEATRSHTVPFTETWMQAADEVGMAVSIEGTWPWLMLKGEPPTPELLKIWKEEWLSMMRKARNHPSIVLWTVNNEMKFPNADKKKPGLLLHKWTILDDAIRAMRQVDATRPIVADSSYMRKEADVSYETVVKPHKFDDGDIDDLHAYYGWYNPTFFHFFKGEIGQKDATPGRPLISQEMSTGYPRNDGHPTRSYLYGNLTPQALVGDYAYENNDPAIFLTRQSFLTKELAETIRRADRADMAGVLHFCYMSWIRDVWDAKKMQAMPTYLGVKQALQPVLVSAELYGRHWYAGRETTCRVCIANDSADARDLPASRLVWEVRAQDKVLSSGTQEVPAVRYYQNQWLNVVLKSPVALPTPRVDAKLVLRVEADGKIVSTNQYDLLLATKEWTAPPAPRQSALLYDPAGKSAVIVNGLGLPKLASLDQLGRAGVLVVGEGVLDAPGANGKLLDFVHGGGRVLLLHPAGSLEKMLPGEVGPYRKTAGEMVNARIPEHPAFDELQPLDMAWFEMGAEALPRACAGSYEILEDAPNVTVLATQYDPHGYLEKPELVSKFGGSPLLEIRHGQGTILASELMLETHAADPVSGRLLVNLLNYLEDLPPHSAR